jgi:BolA protein
MPEGTVHLIRNALEQALDPLELEIVDDSGKHAGHAGARNHGGGHYAVRIRSERFRSQTRLARHRMVHAALGDAFRDRIHALSITALAPDED